MKYPLTLVFLLLTSYLIGQNPYFYKIDKSQGLLSNSIYDIYEDSTGLMWFASDKGLCSFNGYTFKHYSQENMTTKAGSCIREDSFGRIWYQNFDGYLYYVQDDSLTKLNQQKAIGYFKFGIIGNQLYIINEKGMDVYDLKKLQLSKTIPFDTSFLKAINFNKNKIYVFTNKLGIIENDIIKKEIEFPEDFNRTFNSIIVEKSGDGLLICSKFSNYCYYFFDDVFMKKKLSIDNTVIQNMSWCNDLNWLCTTTGLIRLDKNKTISKLYFNDLNVSYIYKTKNSKYWISTLTEGLYFIENFNTQLIPNNKPLTSIISTKDHLFLGTNDDKILNFDKKSEKFKTIYSGSTNHQIGQLHYDDYNQQLSFTSSKFGFLDNRNYLFKDFKIAVKKVSQIDDKYFAFSASSSSGLFKIKSDKSSKWDFVFNYFNSKTEPNYCNIITNQRGKATVFNDQNNTIYYATNNGLFSISLQAKIKEILLNGKSINCNKLSENNGIIYAANADVRLYEIRNSTVKEIQLPDQIDKNNIERTFLRNEILFMVSNSHIYEYSITKKSLKTILKVDNKIEINDIIKENSTYYITSNNGLIVKKSTQTLPILPSFKVIQVNSNSTLVSKEKLKDLTYDQNNITIYYNLLSPTPFDESILKYRINGLEWQKITTSNSKLVFNSLKSGDYSVEFSLNDIQLQNQKVQFTIKKPLWLQWPCMLLIFLVTSSILYFVYCTNIKKIKRRNQLVLDKITLEKSVNLSKLKAIKSQMNPHFFYNALNTIQSYILSNEKELAIGYLSKFSTLTRSILEMTEKDFISVEDEINTLALYLEIEKARFNEDFEFIIKTENISEAENIKIPTMFLQPFVENAVKHGLLHKKGAKKLDILFSIENEVLSISISDNGIGRRKSNELNSIKNKNHKSFATEALMNRIVILNKTRTKPINLQHIDKNNSEHQASGTTVNIEIPL